MSLTEGAKRGRVVRDLFEEAVELGPEARRELLERRCGSDSALRREVARLLRTHDEDDSFLEVPYSDALLFDGGDPRIGPYRLIRLLGAGGTASVYLARRTDGAYRGAVAIKLLRFGLDEPRLVELFRRERQILADLDHPSIARLLDGGSCRGLPYLVMEYVEGEPITRHCEQRRLGSRARIELFLKVGDAVAHAHRHLVVHRDLKPNNVLIDDLGQVKVLDFGIAKLLDDPERTATAGRLFTPAYASPEQIAGAPIATTSDVFSLGMLLAELLTGHRPSRDWRADGTLALRSGDPVEGSGPNPPGASSREVARVLRGDLGRILEKSLHRDPSQRYASVEQLTDDLRRYLEGRPVWARPASVGYRLRKFVRRHGQVVTLAGLIGLLGVVSAWQSVQMGRERARSAQLLMTVFQASDPLDTRERVLDASEILEFRLFVSLELNISVYGEKVLNI